MAVKIRLKRMGKKFAPFYRVVVLDSRKKRDGRIIEEIGVYDPMQEPSLIRIDSELARPFNGAPRRLTHPARFAPVKPQRGPRRRGMLRP